MIPIKGFSPDLPNTTEGVLTNCEAFVPYEGGMRAADAESSYSDALAAECLGAATLTKLDGSRRVIAGTASKLYELSGTTWSDVAAGTYTLGATSRWCFTQFGDTSIAANIDEPIQTSSSGAFSAATAPQAAVVESVLSSGGGFVLAFNTIDATYGTRPDAWWCSAVNAPTSWTPSLANLCATGRLLGSEGPIVAAKKFGTERIVAYKAGSLYLGAFVGAPVVWSWQEIPGYGCVGLDAVENLGTAHFVVGQDDIYIFDGSRPQPIAQACRKWFLENSSGTYRNRTIVRYDRDGGLVFIYFPSSGSTTGRPDTCLVYHIASGQWGRDDRSIEAAFTFSQPAVTFDSDTGTFDDDGGVFDEVSAGNRVLAVFNTSHQMQLLNGRADTSSFTLHYIGDDTTVTSLSEARLRYETRPITASITVASAMGLGGTVGSDGTVYSSYDVPGNRTNVFPLRSTARWHAITFTMTGDCEVTGYSVSGKPAGAR